MVNISGGYKLVFFQAALTQVMVSLEGYNTEFSPIIVIATLCAVTSIQVIWSSHVFILRVFLAPSLISESWTARYATRSFTAYRHVDSKFQMDTAYYGPCLQFTVAQMRTSGTSNMKIYVDLYCPILDTASLKLL